MNREEIALHLTTALLELQKAAPNTFPIEHRLHSSAQIAAAYKAIYHAVEAAYNTRPKG